MSIHAHEVLSLLHPQPLTPDNLKQMVINKFGENARFHTCSLQNLTLDELLTFLLDHQKIISEGQHLTLNLKNICQN